MKYIAMILLLSCSFELFGMERDTISQGYFGDRTPETYKAMIHQTFTPLMREFYQKYPQNYLSKIVAMYVNFVSDNASRSFANTSIPAEDILNKEMRAVLRYPLHIAGRRKVLVPYQKFQGSIKLHIWRAVEFSNIEQAMRKQVEGRPLEHGYVPFDESIVNKTLAYQLVVNGQQPCWRACCNPRPNLEKYKDTIWETLSPLVRHYSVRFPTDEKSKIFSRYVDYVIKSAQNHWNIASDDPEQIVCVLSGALDIDQYGWLKIYKGIDLSGNNTLDTSQILAELRKISAKLADENYIPGKFARLEYKMRAEMHPGFVGSKAAL